MNKAKDAKRKYQRYHSTPEEGQKKKAYMRKYRREHQEEISMAKKEYYEQKTTQLSQTLKTELLTTVEIKLR